MSFLSDVERGKTGLSLGIIATLEDVLEMQIVNPTIADWRDYLDERELKEVGLASVYAKDFAHGTAGHNRLMLIAKMTKILDGEMPA